MCVARCAFSSSKHHCSLVSFFGKKGMQNKKEYEISVFQILFYKPSILLVTLTFSAKFLYSPDIWHFDFINNEITINSFYFFYLNIFLDRTRMNDPRGTFL